MLHNARAHINNKRISHIARVAGAPLDKGSGIYLYHLIGDSVKRGEKLYTIYSESGKKLDFALELVKIYSGVELR